MPTRSAIVRHMAQPDDLTKTTRQQLIDAALAQLATNRMPTFGIVRTRLAQSIGVRPNTGTHHLGGRKLVDALLAEHRRKLLLITERRADHYGWGTARTSEDAAQLTYEQRLEALRKELRRTLLEDLAAYLPGPDQPIEVGRERLYWLCVAFSDCKPLKGELDTTAYISDTNRLAQANYSDTYKTIANILERKPRTGDTPEDYLRVQHAVNTLLEGHIVHSRLGTGMNADDLVDAVIGLFLAMTVPVD